MQARVLIVEDETEISNLISAYLKKTLAFQQNYLQTVTFLFFLQVQ